MATWAQMKLQDASSPLMEELIYFHDYTLMMLTLMTMMVFYGLLSITYTSLTKKLFLEKQKMETMWTMMPAMMLIFIAFPSLQMLYLMDEMKTPYLTMKTMGHQWYWSYEYTDYKEMEFDTYMMPTEDLNKGKPRLLEVDKRLMLPYKNPMRMLVTSTDVLHSWAMPSLGMKMDAMPGRLKQTSFMMKRTGLFFGQCSEMCGAKHSFMPMVMESMPFKKFENWMSNKMET